MSNHRHPGAKWTSGAGSGPAFGCQNVAARRVIIRTPSNLVLRPKQKKLRAVSISSASVGIDAIRPKQRPSPHRGITGRVLRAGFAGPTGARASKKRVDNGTLGHFSAVAPRSHRLHHGFKFPDPLSFGGCPAPCSSAKETADAADASQTAAVQGHRHR
jgi:hypothetical protein